MRIQPGFQPKGRADFDQHDSEKRSRSQRGPAQAGQKRFVAEQSNRVEKEEKGKSNSESDVEQVHDKVRDGGRGISVQVDGAER